MLSNVGLIVVDHCYQSRDDVGVTQVTNLKITFIIIGRKRGNDGAGRWFTSQRVIVRMWAYISLIHVTNPRHVSSVQLVAAVAM